MVELVKQGADRLAIAGLTGAVAASRYVGATASGAPASGTFAVGDFVIDQTGSVHVCTVAGTPGTWVSVGSGGLATHLADTTDAHDASAISADSTTLVGTGTDVQAVLEELDNGIADHLADTTAAHAATAISFTPAGTIAATTVQAAIEEVATEAGAGGAVRVEDEGTSIVAAATGINFAGAGVTVTDAGSNEALVTIPGGGSGTFSDYVPVITQSGTVTHAATIARYEQTGKRVTVVLNLAVTGTGSASNAVTVSLPVTARDSGMRGGSGIIYDASAGLIYRAVIGFASTTTINFEPTNSTVANVLGVTSFTAALASGDQIHATFVYEAA